MSSAGRSEMFDHVIVHAHPKLATYRRLRDIVISDYPIVKSLVYPRPLVLAGPAGVGRRALVQGLKVCVRMHAYVAAA